jgi:hypothetical protein
MFDGVLVMEKLGWTALGMMQGRSGGSGILARRDLGIDAP